MLDPNHSSGYGVDTYLSHASFAPQHQYSIGLPLDHIDKKSMTKVNERQRRTQEIREKKENRKLVN
jgi:hypothetical protein